MTTRQIKKIKNMLNMQNQERLKNDIKTCKEFYILKQDKKELYEKVPIILDSFQDILHFAGLPSASMSPQEVTNAIIQAFNI